MIKTMIFFLSFYLITSTTTTLCIKKINLESSDGAMVPPPNFPYMKRSNCRLAWQASWKMMGTRVWLMKAVDAYHKLTLVTTCLRRVTPTCIISISKRGNFQLAWNDDWVRIRSFKLQSNVMPNLRREMAD